MSSHTHTKRWDCVKETMQRGNVLGKTQSLTTRMKQYIIPTGECCGHAAALRLPHPPSWLIKQGTNRFTHRAITPSGHRYVKASDHFLFAQQISPPARWCAVGWNVLEVTKDYLRALSGLLIPRAPISQ